VNLQKEEEMIKEGTVIYVKHYFEKLKDKLESKPLVQCCFKFLHWFLKLKQISLATNDQDGNG